eukprot:3830623-Pyramimonas_sp.AAC.1
MTEDRELWAEEVERYAVQSMTCDDSRARNRELARSRLRTRRALGPDGISVELLKSLSWRSVRFISRVFSDIFNGLRPTPREWQEVYLTLKPETNKLETLRQTRNLLVGNTLAK